MTSFKTILFLQIILIYPLIFPLPASTQEEDAYSLLQFNQENGIISRDANTTYDYTFLKLNTDLHFFENLFLYTDSISQRRLSSYKNLNYSDFNYEGVPMYSGFDGNYNINFINPDLLESIFETQYSKSIKFNHLSKIQDTLATVIELFSGTKNSKFEIRHIGSKKNFFWEINPIFENSSGYSYSNKNTKNPFDIIKIRNSGYQNISAFFTGGYSNEQAEISVDGYFSNADLYIPNKLNFNHFRTHFNDYNLLIGKFNFYNKFSPNFIISGNIFYKYAYRNQLVQYDSLDAVVTSTSLNLSEYIYGTNFSIEFPTFFQQNTEITLYYTQGVDINFDLKDRFNKRLEDENLVVTIFQNLYNSKKLITNLELQYFQRNINHTELGDLPKNKLGWNLFLNNYYKISEIDALTFQFEKFSNPPFNSQYYAVNPEQLANPDLKQDNNYLIDLYYDRKINDNFTGNIALSLARNDNLICNIPIAQDTFRFENYGSKTSLGIKPRLNYQYRNFTAIACIEYVLSKFENDIQKLQPNMLYPKFNIEVSGLYEFGFGLNTRLDLIYSTGTNSYNSTAQEIASTKNVFLTNIYFEQVFDEDRIYLILNNITNEIYYNYFNLPNSGINFLMGVLLTF